MRDDENDPDDRERVLRARVSDPDLLESFEDAEEDSTMAAVLRDALRTYLNDDGDESDETALSETARKGLSALRDTVGGTGVVSVGVAETKVAAATNIKKEDVRGAVLSELRTAGHVTVSSRTYESIVQVLPPGVTADTSESDDGDSGRDSDVWTAKEPTPEESLAKYERAGIKPPEELLREAGTAD
jgi:hypothetical protein